MFVYFCPNAAIRGKVYDKTQLQDAPAGFMHVDPIGKEFLKENEAYTLQVSVEDCTGCNLCVEICPVESKKEPGHKAINMVEKLELEEKEKQNWEFFLGLPEIDRSRVNQNTVKGGLLYTSDAADERSSVDLGGRRIIKKINRDKQVDKRTIREK